MATAKRQPRQRARFGTVRQLTSGRWQARYKVGGQTYLGPHTFGSKSDAWAWLATVEASIHSGQWRPASQRARIILDDYAEKWIRTHPRLKASTRQLYESDYTRYLGPYLGHLALTDITPDLVRTWYATLGDDLRTNIESRRGSGEHRRYLASGAPTTARAYLPAPSHQLARPS